MKFLTLSLSLSLSLFSILLDKKFRSEYPHKIPFPPPNRYHTILKQRHVQVALVFHDLFVSCAKKTERVNISVGKITIEPAPSDWMGILKICPDLMMMGGFGAIGFYCLGVKKKTQVKDKKNLMRRRGVLSTQVLFSLLQAAGETSPIRFFPGLSFICVLLLSSVAQTYFKVCDFLRACFFSIDFLRFSAARSISTVWFASVWTSTFWRHWTLQLASLKATIWPTSLWVTRQAYSFYLRK